MAESWFSQVTIFLEVKESLDPKARCIISQLVLHLLFNLVYLWSNRKNCRCNMGKTEPKKPSGATVILTLGRNALLSIGVRMGYQLYVNFGSSPFCVFWHCLPLCGQHKHLKLFLSFRVRIVYSEWQAISRFQVEVLHETSYIFFLTGDSGYGTWGLLCASLQLMLEPQGLHRCKFWQPFQSLFLRPYNSVFSRSKIAVVSHHLFHLASSSWSFLFLGSFWFFPMWNSLMLRA